MKSRLFAKIILLVMLVIVGAAGETMAKDDFPLSRRTSPRPKTTPVPHIQIGVKPAPEVNSEPFRRVYLLPGVEKRPSLISLPGAWGVWLGDKLTLVQQKLLLLGENLLTFIPMAACMLHWQVRTDVSTSTNHVPGWLSV